jgi:hypothetical protein
MITFHDHHYNTTIKTDEYLLRLSLYISTINMKMRLLEFN